LGGGKQEKKRVGKVVGKNKETKANDTRKQK